MTDYKLRRTMWYSPKKGERLDYERRPGVSKGSHRPDLVGLQFGWVKIISPDTRMRKGYRHLLVQCQGCGVVKWIDMGNLLSGKTGGCQKCNQPVVIPKWLRGRMSAAQQRCQNPECPAYKHYGMRGIEFRFKTATEAGIWVIENLGLEKGKELDRIDNEGDYEPGNLRWATRGQNASNTRKSKDSSASFHKFRELYPEVRYADNTLRHLISRGFSFDEILARYNAPSCKPKGLYGTFSTADPVIASQFRED